MLSFTGTITMARRKTRSTIKEVAAMSGVSTQTVSRVINERPDVAQETRKRVQDVIQKLGYQPSALARSLIRQRSHTLGVVTAGLKYIGPSRTLNGITATAEEAGYALLIKELPHFDTTTIEPIFQAFLSRHVDGIIWAVPEVGENRNWINSLPLNSGLPIVYLTMNPHEGIPVVTINNYLGGQIATSHLIKEGYKKIGHISGPLDWWEARQRMAGWRDVLTEASLGSDENRWVEGNWSSASGAQAVEKLIKQFPEMDAVFIANDQMALGAMQVIYQRGLRIPEDIGIIGFDNIPESAFFFPPLTTVEQNQYQVAKLAVEEIIKIVELRWQESDSIVPQSIVLEPTLVARKSSLRLKT